MFTESVHSNLVSYLKPYLEIPSRSFLRDHVGIEASQESTREMRQRLAEVGPFRNTVPFNALSSPPNLDLARPRDRFRGGCLSNPPPGVCA